MVSGWYPWVRRGVNKDGRSRSLALWTCFQIEYGIPLGPGADVLEDFRSAEDTSAGITGGTSLNAGRLRGGAGEGLGGKKCCRSVLLILVGEEASSRVGNRSGALPAAIFLASQTDHVSTLATSCDQWTLLADWIALKYAFQATRAWAGKD